MPRVSWPYEPASERKHGVCAVRRIGSRSGSTIVGGMLIGIDKRAATEFSFFLAIPIMVGAFALDIWESRDALSSDQVGIIAVGFVASFVFGLIVVKLLLDFVSKRGFAPFGWWRILVGSAGLAAIHLAG